MAKLNEMKNIGKTLAEKIIKVDILSSEDLIKTGSKETFLKVKSIYPDACINHLYAIEGAIQNVRWHHLDDKIKEDLKSFYNSL